MKTRPHPLLALSIFCFLSFGSPTLSLAHEKEFETHPARDVVVSYLSYAMGQDWPKAAALIEEASLAGLRDRYLRRIANARVFQEELDMCHALDCNNLTEARNLGPTDFYIRYHKGIQDRYKVSKEKLDIIIKSKRVKILSLVEETNDGEELAHVLVRTKHDNGPDKTILSLELISMIKLDGKWKVTMDAMTPTILDRKALPEGATKK